VFYIQKGKVKITVVSEQGKEAIVAVLGPDEFCGEGCLTGQPLRLANRNGNDGMRDHAAGKGGWKRRS
jgi:CRP-like cAMP-binding protein